MTHFFTTLPADVRPTWTLPEWAHTDEEPFCSDVGDWKHREDEEPKPGCACRYDPERIERYVVGPIARGEISGLQGLDIYYCRQFIGVGGRK